MDRLTERERSTLVNDLRLYDQMESEALAEILSRYQIDDMSVEDPPLEETISKLFKHVSEDGNGRSETSELDEKATPST